MCTCIHATQYTIISVYTDTSLFRLFHILLWIVFFILWFRVLLLQQYFLPLSGTSIIFICLYFYLSIAVILSLRFMLTLSLQYYFSFWYIESSTISSVLNSGVQIAIEDFLMKWKKFKALHENMKTIISKLLGILFPNRFSLNIQKWITRNYYFNKWLLYSNAVVVFGMVSICAALAFLQLKGNIQSVWMIDNKRY